VLLLVFSALGTWQTKRAIVKKGLEEAHRQAPELSLDRALSEGRRFARVSAHGNYDQERHFLLDNQIWQGRAGVYVFTPFFTAGGDVVLVNRGWLPLAADRKSLPDISTPRGDVVVKGVLNRLPVPGRILGAPDRLSQDKWPQLLTYMDLDDLSGSLQQPLESWIVQLDQSDPTGFEGRDWKPVFLSSGRHRAYAFQWFALSAACIILWVVIGFKHSSGKEQ
jgi:surfeit locus 1 family protein